MNLQLSSEDRARRRTTFNEVAAAYDNARPTYPAQLFDDLVQLIPGEREVVEIGCGTGQATRPLLERGCRVTAVELGEEMAAIAQDRLAEFGSNFHIVRSSFEDSNLPSNCADAVAAATAFHWIEPGIALSESARLLRRGGVLAVWRIVDTAVPRGEPDFIAASQPIYEDLGIATAEGHVYFSPGARPPEYVEQMRATQLFHDVTVRRYANDQLLTTETYLAQRRTHSDVLTLPVEIREELLSRVATLLDTEFGGSFVRYAETVLCTAIKP